MLDSPAATFDVLAGLAVVERSADPDHSPRLVALYEDYHRDGVKRDAGGLLRAALLRALVPAGPPGEPGLAHRAMETVEFLPPGRQEVCAPLRAAGLAALAAWDPAQAPLHAVRLLADPYLDQMSGEPALTATRVLAALGQTAALYTFALAGGCPVGEVVAESLRSLTELPPALVRDLADRYPVDRSSAAELAGIAELVTAHPARDRLVGVFAALLDTRDVDLLAYLAALGLSSGPEAAAAVRQAARGAQDPTRARLLADALSPSLVRP